MNPLYIDVHVLQSVPPSNMNRDDAGSPKQAIYGGARRARVSSQAWKRATRKRFAETQPMGDRATRTRQLAKLLTDRLVERAGLDEGLAQQVCKVLLGGLKITAGKKEDQLSYLLFFGMPQLDAVVDQVAALNLAGDASEAELKEALQDLSLADALGSGHPVDVALFGRMVADLPNLNVDAAVQVAHALSTHPVEIEFDYFTAVDDENPKEDTGAGMIGNVEFNSATLYRYATIGLHQLVENLGGSVERAEEAVRLFIDSFVKSMPTGHQNSFGNRTRPGLVALVVREDQPVNLVSAFEAPVRRTDGVFDESVKRLAETFKTEGERWGDSPLFAGASFDEGRASAADAADAFGANQPFAELLDAAGRSIHQHAGAAV